MIKKIDLCLIINSYIHIYILEAFLQTVIYILTLSIKKLKKDSLELIIIYMTLLW